MIEKYKPRKAVQFTLAAAIVTSSITGIAEIPQVKRAWQAFNAPNPTCTESQPGANQYDIIAVFGLDDSNENTSPSQKNAVINQAASSYIAKSSDKIVVIGNITAAKEKSIFRAIKKRVIAMYYGQDDINRNNVDFINHAVTYAEGVDKLAQLMKADGSATVLGISSIFYTNRLSLLSQNYGINMSMIPAECFEGGPVPESITETKDIIVAEKLGIMYSAIDPHWKIATKLTRSIKDLKSSQPDE